MAMPALGSPRIISITMAPSMPSPAMPWPMLAIYTTIRIIRCRWTMICRRVRRPHRRRRRCRCATAWAWALAWAWAWLWCMAIRPAGVPSMPITTMWQRCQTIIQCWSTATATATTTTTTAAYADITDIRSSRAAHWAAPSRSSATATLSSITSTRAENASELALVLELELGHILLLFNMH